VPNKAALVIASTVVAGLITVLPVTPAVAEPEPQTDGANTVVALFDPHAATNGEDLFDPHGVDA
jgi:hypothetical protein